MTSPRVVGIGLAPILACFSSPGFAQELRFDVPKQPAVSGIPAFARQAGVQIVAPVSQLHVQKTNAVRGVFTVEAALTRLLRGTGLRVMMRAGNVISLAPSSASSLPDRHIAARRAPVSQAAARPPQARPPDLAAPDIIVFGTRNRLSPLPQDEKRQAINFVSSVGSVELGQRTDVSVASAALRLPGVVLSRGTQTAQAWYPAIRGFDGRYSSVTLDGSMLYLSTRNQRGIPLDFLPAAAINEIVVNKTVTPDMDPNSIGGHIEIRTLRVFDNSGKPLTNFDAQLVDYTKGGALSNHNPSFNINGVLKRTVGSSGNFGFVFAGSAHRDHFNELLNSTTALVQQGGIDIPSGNLLTGNYDRYQRGKSLLGKVEGRGDRWYGYLATNFFDEHIREDLSRSNVSVAPALVTDATEGQGRFTGATPSAISNVYRNDRRIISIRSGSEVQIGERSKLIANASFLHVDYKEQLQTGGAIAGPRVSGDYSLDDTRAATRISGPAALNDPSSWEQRSDAPAISPVYPLKDRIYTARLEYKFNGFEAAKGFGYDIGFDFRRLHRTLDQTTTTYTLPAGASIKLSQVLANGSSFRGGDPSSPIYVDADRYWRLISSLAVRSIDPNLTSDYDLREDVIAPFFSVSLTGDRFRVLGGARYNITRYKDTTHQLVGAAPVPFSISRSLPYLLPNLQGYYDAANGVRIRAALTKTTALQDFSTFANGTATGYDYKGNLVINHTNPYLRPRRSFNEDIGIEIFRTAGYFSLGYFHKTIVDESQVLTEFQYDPNGVFVASSQNTINAGGEHTQGVEFEGQWRDLGTVAPWLEGLTLDLNGAWFSSKTSVLDDSGNRRSISGLRLQPKWVVNLIASYSRGRFFGSVLGMVRGRALYGIATTSPGDIYIAPFATLDTKLVYRLRPGLRLYVEGKNLTDHWYRELTGIRANLVSTAIKDGRTFVLGASANF